MANEILEDVYSEASGKFCYPFNKRLYFFYCRVMSFLFLMRTITVAKDEKPKENHLDNGKMEGKRGRIIVLSDIIGPLKMNPRSSLPSDLSWETISPISLCELGFVGVATCY